MITEDYVSFETAKLLKEKGFNEYCRAVRSPSSIGTKGLFYSSGEVKNIEEKKTLGAAVACPTLQMAMKWLREVHKLFIDIFPCDKPNNFLFNIYKIHDTCLEVVDNEEIFYYNTYEEAAEAVIKHCLENLI